jgi:hypothetical protein
MNGKYLLLICFIATITSAIAQTNTAVSQIPANVKSTFDHYYPNATNVTWEQEGVAYFIPIFTTSAGVTKLVIDLKGQLIQTSVKILPSAVTSYVSANYSGQSVSDAEKLTMYNNSTRYEAIVGGKDLLFDNNGDFIKLATSFIKQ